MYCVDLLSAIVIRTVRTVSQPYTVPFPTLAKTFYCFAYGLRNILHYYSRFYSSFKAINSMVVPPQSRLLNAQQAKLAAGFMLRARKKWFEEGHFFRSQVVAQHNERTTLSIEVLSVFWEDLCDGDWTVFHIILRDVLVFRLGWDNCSWNSLQLIAAVQATIPPPPG